MLIAAAIVAVLAVAGVIVALTRGDDSKGTSSTSPPAAETIATESAATTPPTEETETATVVALDTAPVSDPVTDAATIAPVETDPAPTTTVVPTGSLTVGKTVWYAGFEIAIASATYGPVPNLVPGVRVTVNGLATNLTNKPTNFGFISLTGPVTFESAGASVSADLPLTDVSPNASTKVQFTADFETLDPNDVVIDFGGPERNGARLPLSAGEPVTVQPTTFPLNGSITSSRGVVVSLTQALVAPYDPVSNGGGDVTQADAGEVFVLVTAHVTFDGELDDGVDQPTLLRPDGVSITSVNSDNALLESGSAHDDTYVFPISATFAGNYTLQFPTFRDPSVNQLPFKLG